MMTRNRILSCLVLLMIVVPRASAQWSAAKGPLATRWAKDVSPDNALPQHPRPQMVRDKWQSLNGLWDYAIRPQDQAQPKQWDGKILVPFCAESALSGVMKPVGPGNRLWYRRSFKAPPLESAGRLLLHFGAVDWDATVWVNGKKLGQHTGGYDPFTFDVTGALAGGGEQELVVSVWDPTNSSWQPRGKQVLRPGGIFYTAVTGIWQTVWLEPVPSRAIQSVRFTPDIDHQLVKVLVKTTGDVEHLSVRVDLAGGGDRANPSYGKPNEPFAVPVRNARLWSPDVPTLYEAKVSLTDDRLRTRQIVVDTVNSYFGMRKVEVRKDVDGFNRLFLNNKPLFMFGPLDQGWWPDGLYTAPTDDALRYDIEVTKKLGMNMARKHVKVEPDRWYYWCDKLGLLVWQDMPSGDRSIGGNDPDLVRSAESAANYRRELQAMIDARGNHPCIVAWVPFNEGWGQFDTVDILAWTKKYDPTRLVDGPSGWADRGVGDMHDMHRYPGPGMPAPEDKRAVVLGEFGGLGLPLTGHLWQDKKNWGYRTFESRQALQGGFEQLMRNLRPLIARGLSAAVYTQTTDVEGEVNGLMTYDRAIIKVDPARVAKMHRRFYEPPPIVITKTLAPTSEQAAQTWRYTTDKPADDWFKPDFNDTSWSKGPAGFGTSGTPGTTVRTQWKTPDIWIRRTFDLPGADVASLYLRIHHDEDAQVYVNGRRVASLTGYTTEYEDVETDEASRSALRPGRNTIAVHCHQTGGGQYIDVGLLDVTEKPRPQK